MAVSHILPVAWLCSTCGNDATHYAAATPERPVIALPCGHPNPEGLTWQVGEHRGRLGGDGRGRIAVHEPAMTFHAHTRVGP